MPTEQLALPIDVQSAWAGFQNLSLYRQTSLLSTASRKILNFCRREHFVQQTLDEFYNGQNHPRIWLRHKPIVSVMSVKVNGVALDNTYGDTWCFDSKKGSLIRGTNLMEMRFNPWFPRGTQNVEVVYWAGFPEVPPDIVEATVQYVRYLSEQIKITGIFSEEDIGDYSYKLNTAASSMTLPKHIANLCADYVQDDGPV